MNFFLISYKAWGRVSSPKQILFAIYSQNHFILIRIDSINFSHTNYLATGCFVAKDRVWQRFERYITKKTPMH
jgi:hypothetical protein